MPSANSWSGWVGFSAVLAMIIGTIDIIMGLIAVIRGEYYAIHGNAVIIFDTTAWGWITIIIGAGVMLVALGLASRAGWARWLTLVVVSLNLFASLGWLGNTGFPLWALTVVTLQIIVIYALTARWSEAGPA